MSGRTTNARLITDLVEQDVLPSCEFNKAMDGLDRQAYSGIKYVGGDGVVIGGEILDTGYVGPTTALADGYAGAEAGNTAIQDLINGVTNKIWCVRVDPPTSGPYEDWCGYPTTFNDGVLQFIAADVQPPHSFRLGDLPVGAGGVIGTPDNEVLDRPIIIEAAAKTWRGSVNITGLAEGDTEWVDVDHSADIEFESTGLLQFYNPKPAILGGFDVWCLENCQPGQFGFYTTNAGGGGDPYYGETSVTLYWARTGVPEKHTIPIT